MDTRSLLIFDLDGERFGVDATWVRECVWLPQLTPVEEAPPWVVGLFSLRGQIVPVIDLRVRFGHPPRPYGAGEQVVVLDADGVPMGLIVDEVLAVDDVPAAAIQPPPRLDGAALGRARLITGEARVGENLVALLDVSRLSHSARKPRPHSVRCSMPAPWRCAKPPPRRKARASGWRWWSWTANVSASNWPPCRNSATSPN